MLAVSGCKETEDEPSQIPTVPTTFSLEDGAEIKGLSVTLNAKGSTVEDRKLDVSYVYYIGKSADDLEETTAEVTLEPYTQYFWRAQAKTEAGEGELSEIHTFYCVPDLELSSDNGSGEWAAIIRWNNADKFKSVTITATPDHEGYTLENQTIEGGVDSCYFKTTEPKNDAYTHWWDDEHGVYYEPVIYTFDVEAKAQVGNKTFTFTSSIKEILLDNEFEVRDHEFNVYRVVQIGNQKWFADDFRAKTTIDGSTLDYVTSELESGSIGILYFTKKSHLELIANVAPKGYHISTNEDWVKLEAYYGVDKEVEYFDYMYNMGDMFTLAHDTSEIFLTDDARDLIPQFFSGVEQNIGKLLASGYDWKQTNETNHPDTKQPFNAKPFGAGRDFDKAVSGAHIGACYTTYPREYYRIIWAYSTGIAAIPVNHNEYLSVRLVKD